MTPEERNILDHRSATAGTATIIKVDCYKSELEYVKTAAAQM